MEHCEARRRQARPKQQPPFCALEELAQQHADGSEDLMTFRERLEDLCSRQRCEERRSGERSRWSDACDPGYRCYGSSVNRCLCISWNEVVGQRGEKTPSTGSVWSWLLRRDSS